MSHERVLDLLGSHKVRIARALVRQTRALSLRYAGLDQNALEASLLRLLTMFARFVETGDDANLREYTRHTAQLRLALGFKVDDFLLAALAWLPVLRRFLFEHAESPQQGLEDYEAIEAILIPLLAESAAVFGDASDELDDDDETAPNGKRISISRGAAFAIERVIGSAEEELTPFT